MARIQFSHEYNNIISVENLLGAWKEFKNGKRGKEDVALFERNLMDNIFQLNRDLGDGRYCHAGYKAFKISDPKPRDIHKASVRDRLVHHAIYRELYWFFDRKFIHDSYSCRACKGTHKAMDQFRTCFRKVSKNDTKTCWVLKCDIRKFFASIDHEILKKILYSHIQDQKILILLENIIDSFCSVPPPCGGGGQGVVVKKGLPLGNLTSQLLVNIYMNEFDQFVKHKMKQKFYVRYADDFVFLSQSKQELENLIPFVKTFLDEKLKLEIHPDKLFIKTFSSGVDFLGWIHFSDHRVLRTATKRRMFRNLEMNHSEEIISSYLGMLSHGNAWKLAQEIKDIAERMILR